MCLINTLILSGLSPQGIAAQETLMVFERRGWCIFMLPGDINCVPWLSSCSPFSHLHKPACFESALQEASRKQAGV